MTNADDHLAVARALYTYASAIDRRDWDECRSVLHDPIEIDFAGYDGGGSAQFAADFWVAGIKTRMEPLITQHLLANPIVEIDGDQASCRLALRATYQDGDGERFEVGGTYDNRLRRHGAEWRITALRLHIDWAEGRRQILADTVVG